MGRISGRWCFVAICVMFSGWKCKVLGPRSLKNRCKWMDAWRPSCTNLELGYDYRATLFLWMPACVHVSNRMVQVYFWDVWGLKGTILVVVNLIEENIFDWTSEETQTKQSATKTNNYSNYLLVKTSPNRKSRVSLSRCEKNTNSGTSWYAIGPCVMVHTFPFSNLHPPFISTTAYNSFIIGRSLAGEAWNQQSAMEALKPIMKPDPNDQDTIGGFQFEND